MAIVTAITLLLSQGVFFVVHAVNPTPPTRQGYSTSVYFEAVSMDSTSDLSSTIARYSKVQRVSVRFTDLASGILKLTPTWDSSATSSIQSIVTSNIRCFNCTVTYSGGDFVIRPAGAMDVTFEVIYLNYASGSLLFNTTPFFTFTASSFDDSGITAYEVPISDSYSHANQTSIYNAVDGVESALNVIGQNTLDTATNTDTLVTLTQGTNTAITQSNSYLNQILSNLNQSSSTDVSNNASKQSTLSSQSSSIHSVDTGVLDSMDTALDNEAVKYDVSAKITSTPNASTSFSWVSNQMQRMVSLGSDITPMWEFMFVAPLVVGLALTIIGKSTR